MTASLLQITALRKSFGSLVVSDDVTFDVRLGELHALIGPNGAGKTTLIDQLSGQLASDRGRIVFDGADITRLDQPARVRLGLARSFQITSLLPGYTALENVAIAVQARSGSSFRFLAPVSDETTLNDAAAATLARVGLAEKGRVRAGTLSHGEKRLLEVAVALATAPKLLLLDEPLAGLGLEECKSSIELLQGLKSELTILLVEHDMDAVFALADRVSVLVNGRVMATGIPAHVRADAGVRSAYLGDEEIW
jgi:branched-chain amino acid transport system ATP-binding protein